MTIKPDRRALQIVPQQKPASRSTGTSKFRFPFNHDIASSPISMCAAPSPARSINQQRQDAWRTFAVEPVEALPRLFELGPGNPLLADRAVGRSNLSLLLEYATQVSESSDPKCASRLREALDLFERCLKHDNENDPRDIPIAVVGATMRPVIRMTVIWRMRTVEKVSGARRMLPYDPRHARQVLDHLALLSTETIYGVLAFDTARDLAQHYISHLHPDDPLVLIWQRPGAEPPSILEQPSPSVLARHASPTTALDSAHPLASRANTALAELDGQHHASSAASPTDWDITAPDLIALLAPALLTTLRTAPVPPLGITSTFTHSAADGQTDASAYAGKVYSSHEFRNRETTMPSGLGANSNANMAGAGAKSLAVAGGGGASILSGNTRLGWDPRDGRGPQRFGPIGRQSSALEALSGFASVQYGAYGGYSGVGYAHSVHGGQGAHAGLPLAQGPGAGGPGMGHSGGLPGLGAADQGLTVTAMAFVPGASRPASRHVDEWSR